MKVVHMTSVHRADDVRIFMKECRTLAEAGYSVSLIAPARRDHVINNIKIIAVPQANNKLVRLISSPFILYKKAVEVNGDVYHFHDPELIPLGLVLKFRGKKVIYDVHEDLPLQILNKVWIPNILRKPASLLAKVSECVASRCFDKVIAVTPSIAEKFPSNKTVLVQNYPITNEFSTNTRSKSDPRFPTIVYAGGITRVRGVLELISAIEIINKREEVKLVIAGAIQDKTFSNFELNRIMHSKNVDYMGWVNRKTLRRVFSNCTLGAVLFYPVPNHINSQPNKIFEYMSAGLPVIASDFPLWREIISKNKCGILVNPQNTDEIANSISWIINNPIECRKMGARGQQAVTDKYSWESESKQLLSVYRDIQ